MPINPDQLDKEASDELAALMNEGLSTENTPDDVPPLPPLPTEPKQDATPPAPEEKKADTDAGNWEERYKNLQAHSTKVSQDNSALKQQLAQLNQKVEQLHSQSAVPPAPKDVTPDELEQAAKDFEELAPFHRRMQEQQKVIDQLQQEREQQNQKSYYDRIAAVHPDHAEIYHSPEFQGWVSRLTGVDRHGVEFAFSQGGPEDVIDVFHRYKRAAGIGKSEQAAQLAEPTLRSRSQPQTKPRPKYTFAQINRMSTAEYAKHEKAIDEAIARGEVT